MTMLVMEGLNSVCMRERLKVETLWRVLCRNVRWTYSVESGEGGAWRREESPSGFF